MYKIEVRKSFKDVDNLGRPEWNLHFMAMTYFIANRSFDTSTKCGCIATRDNLILSSGFNGPPAGSLDASVPIDVRPDKYYYMEHSERNAIFNAAKIGINLEGCIFYVTGPPCLDCMRGMLCLHPKEIIYSVGNSCYNFADYKTTISEDLHKPENISAWLYRIAPKTQVVEYEGKAINQIVDYYNTLTQNVSDNLGITNA